MAKAGAKRDDLIATVKRVERKVDDVRKAVLAIRELVGELEVRPSAEELRRMGGADVPPVNEATNRVG